jgi:hypothetical protein
MNRDNKSMARQNIRCPHCGSVAERFVNQQLLQTQCQVCDYLLVTCVNTGRVLETYATGIYARK